MSNDTEQQVQETPATIVTTVKQILKQPSTQLTTRNDIKKAIAQVQALPEPQHLFTLPSTQMNQRMGNISPLTTKFAMLQMQQNGGVNRPSVSIMMNATEQYQQHILSKQKPSPSETCIDPTLEFYHVRPKDPQDNLARFVLLRQWEIGRWMRWKQWHDKQLDFLMREDQKLLRKQSFFAQLQENHPWFNVGFGMNEDGQAMLPLDAESEERRARMHSDGVLNLVSKALQQSRESEAQQQESSIPEMNEETTLMERKNALLKLAQARKQRSDKYAMNSTNVFSSIKSAANIIQPSELLMDIFDEQCPMNQEKRIEPEHHHIKPTPYFTQINMPSHHYLLNSRHRVCVQLYEMIENGRKFPETMSQRTYNRLVARYDILLDAFHLQA